MKCAIGFDDVQELKSFIEEYYTEKKGYSKVATLFFSVLRDWLIVIIYVQKDRGGRRWIIVLLPLWMFRVQAVPRQLAYPLISFGLIPLHNAASFGWMNAPAF